MITQAAVTGELHTLLRNVIHNTFAQRLKMVDDLSVAKSSWNEAAAHVKEKIDTLLEEYNSNKTDGRKPENLSFEEEVKIKDMIQPPVDLERFVICL